MRRPCADREEKRVARGREMDANASAMRYVTQIKTMPKGRRPEEKQTLSNAERQARYLASCQASLAPLIVRTRRPTDRRSRPQRWRDAVNELLALQAEYADWLATLPDSPHNSATAETFEAIIDLDLTTLANIEMPRGYGRD